VNAATADLHAGSWTIHLSHGVVHGARPGWAPVSPSPQQIPLICPSDPTSTPNAPGTRPCPKAPAPAAEVVFIAW
jgi:hypothetical protein